MPGGRHPGDHGYRRPAATAAAIATQTNVVTDVFPALALDMSTGDPDVMKRQPGARDESVLTRGHWAAVGGWAVLLAICVLAALAIAFYALDFPHRHAVSISFLTLAFGKLWFVFNLRHAGRSFFHNDIVKNPCVAGAIALCAVLLLAAVYLPDLSDLLKTENPTRPGWLVVIGMSHVPFICGQILRLIQKTGGQP